MACGTGDEWLTRGLGECGDLARIKPEAADSSHTVNIAWPVYYQHTKIPGPVPLTAKTVNVYVLAYRLIITSRRLLLCVRTKPR